MKRKVRTKSRVKGKWKIAINGILGIHEKIEVFLKKHHPSASLKKYFKCFSKYYQTPIFYLKNASKCF